MPHPQSVLVSPQDTKNLKYWEQETFSEFKERMLSTERPFPCIFGVAAVSRGTLRYGFNHEPLQDQASALSKMLEEFTAIAPSLGKRTSLVVFFKNAPNKLDHRSIYEWFWSLLQRTTQLDPQAWPENISPNPDSPSFEWTFNGQPMFVVVNTPIHDVRRSRFFPTLAITFQPRFVFEDIAEGTEKGDTARKIIRSRLEAYDTTPVTPLLGSYGDPDNREWVQYYLDDGSPIQELNYCPVRNFQGN